MRKCTTKSKTSKGKVFRAGKASFSRATGKPLNAAARKIVKERKAFWKRSGL